MLSILWAAVSLGAMPMALDGRMFPVAESYAAIDGLTSPGTVLLALTVDSNGLIVRCDVTASSGSARLDHAACATQRHRRLRPARDEDGRPLAALLIHRFAIKMTPSEAAALPLADFAIPVDRLPVSATRPFVSMRLVTAIDGSVAQCTVTGSSGNRNLDELACATFSRERLPAALAAGGAPVRAVREISAGFVEGEPRPR